MTQSDGPDNDTARQRAYLALRLKKAGRRALQDLAPPVLWRALGGTRRVKASHDNLMHAADGDPFAVPPEGPHRFRFLAGNPLIEVPVSRMRYAGGLRFTADEHHFVRYLSHGIAALEAFYRNHCPRDVLEKHFLPFSGRADTPLKGLPWIEYQDGEFDRNVPSEKGLAASHGHQHHGPASPQKIDLEASHLDRLRASFEKHGLRDTGEYPTGHFIADADGDWAFYVKDGQHRLAVMAHMGYETARVTLTGGLRVADEASAGHFPMVHHRLLSREEAIAVLRAYTKPRDKAGLFA
ncbi:MAG: hypothetical protein KDJ80_01825 [Nitratireductor sp.]|nr:hypothetical protein [Nitratireductor sp.]